MYGRQEFGPRVGFWRLLDILDKHGLPCTAVLNVAALRTTRHLRGRGGAQMGHSRPRHVQHPVYLRLRRRRGAQLLPPDAAAGPRTDRPGDERHGRPRPAGGHREHPGSARRNRLPLLCGFLSRRPTVSAARQIRTADLDAVFGRGQRRSVLSTAYEGRRIRWRDQTTVRSPLCRRRPGDVHRRTPRGYRTSPARGAFRSRPALCQIAFPTSGSQPAARSPSITWPIL